MATIQDIFDWLNQGAQGDIPGTGGAQPSATPASSSSQQPPNSAPPPSDASMTYRMPQQGISNLGFDDLSSLLNEYHSIANTPPGINLSFDAPKGEPVTPDALATGQPTPQDYTGDLAAQMQAQYDQLVKNGIPPSVARQMVTQPSMGEGEKESNDPWPYHYAGAEQEAAAGAKLGVTPAPGGGEGRAQEAWDNMAAMLSNRALNRPTAEDRVPGDYDTSGLFRLPTGEYAPAAPAGSTSALDYYRSLGDPSSFWWNPQPNTFWGNNLLYGQQAQQGGANQGWQ